MKKLKTAILGSGNIGTDLLVKVLRSPHLECTAFIGRNLTSPGMSKAVKLGVTVSDESIGYLERNPGSCDLVFDATSAADHQRHAPTFKRLGMLAVDLTPAQVGTMCAPAVNIDECLSAVNVNMVTCGGQASIPIAYALSLSHPRIEYIEVVSSIASRSAGPATRRNLDEYIDTTELGLRKFSGCTNAKAILNLNPAQPCVNMQTTLLAKVDEPNIDKFSNDLAEIVGRVRRYVPGYEVLIGPIVENGRIVVMVRVRGLGDYLPAFAGNLDIINCAAVAMAEAYAQAGSATAVRSAA